MAILMLTQEQLLRLANLLEDLAQGRVPPQEGVAKLQQWKDIPWEEKKKLPKKLFKILVSVWEQTYHFEIDQDVFAKDPRYAEACRQALLDLAQRLRTESATVD